MDAITKKSLYPTIFRYSRLTMPMFHEPPERTGPRLVVHSSAAVELDWVLSAAHRIGQSGQPLLDSLYAEVPDVVERVRSLWAPGEQLSYPGYLELSILAHRGGLLFDGEVAGLIDAIEDLAAAPPRDLALASETAGDRSRLLRRLKLLHASKARRHRYAGVLRDVWSAVGPVWETSGRKVVDAAVDARRASLDKGSHTWQELARHEPCCSRWNLDDLVGALGPGGEFAVVPSYFACKGLLVDLPGVVVVGVSARPSGTEARARTALLARRLKSLSDPTRLAILHSLISQELTVSELAAMFAVAQPTVSNHIKVLRDAGLVSNAGDGRTRRLVVQPDVVHEVIGELQRIAGSPPA